MKPHAVILSIALSAIALSAGLTAASANKMDGKCCQWSDGGRSHRYQVIMARRAIPHNCSAYAASCIRDSVHRDDAVPACMAARSRCLQTGIHVGPYSGIQYAGMEKK